MKYNHVHKVTVVLYLVHTQTTKRCTEIRIYLRISKQYLGSLFFLESTVVSLPPHPPSMLRKQQELEKTMSRKKFKDLELHCQVPDHSAHKTFSIYPVYMKPSVEIIMKQLL